MKIPKQEYTQEVKELAFKRVKPGQPISAVVKELGLIKQTLRNWVKAADARKLNKADGKVVTLEQMDLSLLQADGLWLKRGCEILKKATTYFVRDVQ